MRFKGRFSSVNEDIIEEDVKIEIEKIEQLNLGSLYKLKIQSVKGVPEEQLDLGVFYVQENRIYKIEYKGDELEALKNTNKLPDGSRIVCQEDEIKDNLSESQRGYHHYLIVQGNIREYHSYNNKTDSGYFETYIWERDVGLKYYKSGYGAEKNLVELKLLEE